MKKEIVILMLFITALSLNGQGLRREGVNILDHNGNEIILRGLGFGGWMLMEGYMMHSSDVADTQHEFRKKLTDLMGEEYTDTFFDAWLLNHVTSKDIDSLANWGYNSVRLPMHYNLFTLPIEDEPVQGENTWLDKGFLMVDSLLAWCESNEMYLILDLHAAPGGQGANAAICDYDPTKPSLWESEKNRDKTVALWAKLAERYHDETWIGGYDLLNEVNWNIPGNVMLKDLYVEITDAIRAVDTKHIIFIEGNGFANDFSGLTPPWDDNMAYSFHKYWNFNDPGSIGWVLDIREQYNVPLWMGEGGENSNVWFTDAIQLLEDNNIGWAFWPMKRIETIVSPYSIEYSQGYRDVLAYWRGEGPKPSEEEAFLGMMELASNSNSENCLYRKDVHDAQIRQIGNEINVPFLQHEIPGLIHISDFDLGKVGNAYYDVDYVNYSMSTGSFQAWNSGWFYRNDGVDIEPNNDSIRSNGYHLGYVHAGEWTSYTVDIEGSGAYNAVIRVASEASGGEFHLEFNDEAVTTIQTVNSSSGWTNFYDMYVSDIILNQGNHNLKLSIDNNTSFNISSIDFNYIGPADSLDARALYGETLDDEKSIKFTCNLPIDEESLQNVIHEFSLEINGESVDIEAIYFDTLQTKTIILESNAFILHTDKIFLSYDGSSIKTLSGKNLKEFIDLRIVNSLYERFILPTKIQAEDFVYMEGFGLEPTTDQGGGFNLGYASPGDFADYLIYNDEETNFDLSLRLASQYSSGSFGFYILSEDSTEVELITVQVPSTGGWQNWQTIIEEVTMPEGPNRLRMKALSGEFNLNWFRFDEANSIKDINQNDVPNIFPNPVRFDKLNIHLKGKSNIDWNANILSLDGKLVWSGILSRNDNTHEIDVSSIPPGIYALRISNKNISHTVKICRL